jgi:signal transduction histidine kinase
LKHRPLILLLLAALSPLIILSAVIGGLALRQEQAAMRQDAAARVRLASVLVERELDSQVRVLSGIASSPRFDKPAVDEFVALFDRVRQGQPEWINVVLTDTSGTILASVPELPGRATRIRDVESLQRAVATRRPTVGAMMRGRDGRVGFAVRAPIVRHGRVLAVISARIGPNGLARVLTADALPKGWRAAVIDVAGHVAAVTGATVDPAAARPSREALEARQRAPSGFYHGAIRDSVPTITAFQAIPRYGWSVHVLVPLHLYNAPARRAGWLVGAWGGVGLLLSVMFLTLLGREVSMRRREDVAVERNRRMEALGRMTGGVAHDFNNILMIVHGSAEMLKRRARDPERVGALADAVLAAAQRGQALTRQLLTFARRGAYEPAAFSLQARAGALREMIERAVGDRVEVEIDFPEDAWPVYADPAGLEIALLNLAVNARDAMGGAGRVILTATNAALQPSRGAPLQLDGDFVALTFRDTGPGIPEEALAHIFEPFFTTKGAGKGTGLGLSQVYGFAEQSGGTVTVASRPGHGAAFTLYLPRAAARAAPAAERAPAESAGQGRLLVVDDDAEVREAVAAVMEGAGYSVVQAEGAAEALALLDEQPVDAVLSDVVMPGGLSGLELAHRLGESRPGLPVVLMTGYSEALGDGAGCPWPVLAKPFTAAEAVAALGAAHRRAA